MKFGQQFQAELVPEWEDAYCSYTDLKNDISRIKAINQRTPGGGGAGYSRTGSLGLLKSLASIKPGLSGAISRRVRHEHSGPISPQYPTSKDTIRTSKRKTDDGEVYITELREPLSRSAQDKTYFARLDAQLTKVNKFYKKKEGEYIARAGVLEKQMQALLEVQEEMARDGLVTYDYLITSKHQENRLAEAKETNPEVPLIPEDNLKSNEYPLMTFPMRSVNNNDDGQVDNAIQDYIDQVAATNLKQRRAKFADQATADLEVAIPGEVGLSPSPRRGGSFAFSPGGVGLSPSPRRSALKRVSNIPEEPDEEIEPAVAVADHVADIENQKHTLKSEKEFQNAKNLLRLAFVEFYRGLGLLSNYRSLNMTAITKILKRYDKETGWLFAPIYMKEVESSYFATSTKVHKLMTKVEDIFVKHFTDGVRKKAMAQLKPMRTQGTHRTTFFIGLFTGCSIALFISFFFMVGNKNSLSQGGRTTTQYLETVFPVFSTLMLIVLHVFCYAGNVYAWSKTRVNYPFVFGFAPRTELRYRQVLLLASGLTMCLLGGMNIHIAVTLLTVKPAPPPAPAGSLARAPAVEPFYTDVIPLILVVLTLATLFLPFNLMYRSSRMFFLGCLRRLICAPFVKVILPDFFLGDQLTSQVLVFRNLEFMVCFYPTGYFLNGANTKCDLNQIYRSFGYVVALLPFWWRFLQCLRRYRDEKDTHQLENAGKYFAAIVALGLRQAFTNHSNLTVLWILSILASIVATIWASYWDLCVDWGLLKRNSKNKWLRDKIILKHKSHYFIAIGVNLVLRLVWMLSILQVDRKFGWNANAFNVSTGSLEIIRRGIWNYFRIENEHLNNVGKYRAVKAVPLPFNDD